MGLKPKLMFKRFIERPVLSTVISIILTLLGLISLFSLPITLFPDIAPPTVQVTASYPGANAEVVARAVATPIGRSHQWCGEYDLHDFYFKQ